MRDFLKWCQRIEVILKRNRYSIRSQSLPEVAQDEILRAAISCYAGHLPNDELVLIVATTIAQNLNIAPQRVTYEGFERAPKVSRSDSHIHMGSVSIPKVNSSGTSTLRKPGKSQFAVTRQIAKTLESIASAISLAEPVLLVGETGIGKTMAIQDLAAGLGQKLTVVNLSQQSEGSDLLGGFKPLTVRSLALPMVETFDAIFDLTFSSRRNDKFEGSLRRAAQKQNWERVSLLWQEAVDLSMITLNNLQARTRIEKSKGTTKRRRLGDDSLTNLRVRWQHFSEDLQRFKSQLHGGKKGFAFRYVEGKIISALRNGEWVLLDEINLASSETIESITGLFKDKSEGGPSVLLSEAGVAEEIKAHPDFRIFAAMNPATDAGKKDLVPGIRSRFTEIYVQASDSTLKDLVQIISTYLGDLLAMDEHAAPDMAQSYLNMKELGRQNKLTDGAGHPPHFTIRSLVRCLLYIKEQARTFGLRRAMYEGYLMSFSTVLSAASESLIVPLIKKHILRGKNVKALLRQQPSKPKNSDEYVSFEHHRVLRGSEMPREQPLYIRTPFVERNLLNLARAASMQKFPVLLQGPTSAGKTSMIEYLAAISGNIFVRINNHEHTDIQEYLGTYISDEEGKLRYKDGVLVQALKKGYWIVLDELNLAPTDVLEALNRLLDDNRELFVPETQEVVRPHSNFMLFATQNPAGLYGGRKHLSRAFRNRFLELHFDDIPEDELETILRKRVMNTAPSHISKIVAVYKKLALLRQSSRLFEQRNSFATLRDLFRWAFRSVEDREQLALHGFALLGERVRDPNERAAVKSIIEEVMKVKINETEAYASMIRRFQTRETPISWTPAAKRLAALTMMALEHNEPVLLIGETGCGKTQICQAIAQMMGKPLNIYNAHVNTETADLIGSQRPVRHRADAEKRLATELQSLAIEASADNHLEQQDLASLVQWFEKEQGLITHSPKLEKIRQDLASVRALFEWVDGSLVSSMRKGEHFLLDEISLADDSVLERLNSVLEPGRSILLAEKGTESSSIMATGGFQFLATMNPGGDHGKRELSAALRNRLTEIWVPQLDAHDDVLIILQHKLEARTRALAPVMVEFAMWFVQMYRTASLTPGVPLRDLLAWAEFVDRQAHLSIGQALTHGASMVFIDALGATPASLSAASIGDVQKARDTCVDKLQQLVDEGLPNVYSMIPPVVASPNEFKVGQFAIEVDEEHSGPIEISMGAPTTARNALKVLRGLQMPRPILLEGSPGVGKTALISAIAKVAGRSLTRINLSDQTDLMDLFGADAPIEGEGLGKFAWRDGPFLRAMQVGEWVLLDEMNLASQSVLEGLNSCIDHRQEVYISELDRTFKRHPKFTLFAAQNPHSQGGGRKGLPASFVNRFTVIYIDPFDDEDLRTIAQARFPDVAAESRNEALECIATVGGVVQSHRAFMTLGGPWEINLRDLYRWLEAYSQNELHGDVSAYFEVIISGRFRSTLQRHLLDNTCNAACAKNLERSLFSNLAPDTYQIGSALLPRNSLVTESSLSSLQIPISHLSQAESVIHCINRKWPCLLVGASGCGKTSLINIFARVAGVKITQLSINRDTDAYDLIGGYDQQDASSKMSDELVVIYRELQKATRQAFDDGNLPRLTAAIRAAQLLSSEGLDSPEYRSELFECLKPLAGLAKLLQHFVESRDAQLSAIPSFCWRDGPLLGAIERGDWVILDNANLCDPSVLDRLNSLLEPARELALSERQNDDGLPRIVKAHEEFRIFMTVDPKHGELSRAMRNRSVEVFITKADNRFPKSNLVYFMESEIFALRRAKECNDDAGKQMDPIRDELTVDQLPWDLVNQDSGDIELHLSMAQQEELSMRRSLPHTVLDLIEQFRTHELQPYLPFLNEPVLTSNSKFALEHVRMVVELRQIVLHTMRLACELQKAAQQLPLVKPAKRTTFQKGLVLMNQARSSSDPAACMTKFIQSLAAALPKLIVQWIQNPGKDWSNTIRAVSELRHILTDFKVLSWANDCDPILFQTYAELIKQPESGIYTLSAPQYDVLRPVLAHLQTGAQLKTGLGLRVMWPHWKAATVSTEDSLRELLNIESIATDFLNTAFSSKLSVQQISALWIGFCSLYQNFFEHSANVPGSSLQLQEAVAEVRAQVADTALPRTPYFRPEFAALEQKVLTGCFLTQTREPICQSQLQVMAGPDLRKIRAGSFRASPVRYLANIIIEKDDLLSHLLHRIMQCSAVDLGSVPRLQEEIDLMGTVVSQSTQQIAEPTIEHIKQFTQDCLTALNDILDPDAGSWSQTNLLINHVREAKQRYLEAANNYLSDPVDASNNQNTRVASALLLISLAYLYLFVPDQPYDPVIEILVKHDRHERRLEELQNRLQALLNFERSMTGKNTSLWIRQIQTDIEVLGAVPPLACVVRPEISQMPELHADLLSIVRNVIGSKHELVILNEICEAPLRLHELRMLQRTLQQILQRLDGRYRAYDDLVVPIVQFLKCLDLAATVLGLELKLRAEGRDKVALPILRSFPLLGLRPDGVSRIQQRGSEPRNESELVQDLMMLRLHDSKSSSMRQLLHILEQAYSEWKQRLTQDQKTEIKKAKYYDFRGEDDNAEDHDTEQLQSIFPDFSDNQAANATKENHGIDDPTAFAKSIASGFRAAIEQSTPCLLQNIREVIRHSAVLSDNRALTNDAEQVYLLPGVLLSLKQQQNVLAGRGKLGDINIYADFNVKESHKLGVLTEKLHSKFRGINNAWPEHAIPNDVVSYCKELLGVSLNEPLAKLLTRAEKLHSLVNEWQSVTSREYSVASLYDELTNLIIGWRRLELKSWSKLLDTESRKADNEALSWFFVVYETVIHIPMQLLEDREGFRRHASGLTQNIEDFLKASTLGNFTSRLQLLRTFAKLLGTIWQDHEVLSSLHRTLQNVINHYQRYEIAISETLTKSRARMEKEVRDQIQMSSWKDTNIIAMRNSAKKSHAKLFRTIKKFRKLLSQPLSIPTELSSQYLPSRQLPIQHAEVTSNDAYAEAVSQCERMLTDWQERPRRWRFTKQRAQMMRKEVSQIDQSLETCTRLSQYAHEFVATVKELRTKTPGKLTDDNRETVQFLKAQKRKLLSDTIQEVKQMGVRRNLDVSRLEAQRSVAIVLASTPSVIASDAHDAEFHELLDLMPKVRAAPREHHDDLSNADIAKSTGSIEGFLSTILKQRKYLGSVHIQLTDFNATLKIVSSIAQSGCNDIKHRNTYATNKIPALKYRLKWLMQMIICSIEVLGIQHEFAGSDLEILDVVSVLRQAEHDFAELMRASDGIPVLPDHIISQRQYEWQEDTITRMKKLHNLLERATVAEGRIAYLTEQLCWWLNVPDDMVMVYTNGVHLVTVKEFDSSLTRLLDMIFVAVQDLSRTEYALTTENETNNWLTATTSKLRDQIKVMNVASMNLSLQSVINCFANISTSELPTALSLLTLSYPVLAQYHLIVQYLHERLHAIYCETCHLAVTLVRSFITISTEGFCQPSDSSAQADTSGKLEAGTGLGDGEGAEDISKDVGDDEDLSEFAQAENKRQEAEQDEEIDKADNAVDMSREEMNGELDEMGEATGSDSDVGSGDEGNEGSIDEEAGNVDALDPGAVDEKLWEGREGNEESEEGLENEQGEGQASDERAAAQEKRTQEEKDAGGDLEEGQGAEDDEMSVNEEGEAIGRDELEHTDPHLYKESKLDLPDEMQLDGDVDGDESEIDDDKFDELSDVDKDDGQEKNDTFGDSDTEIGENEQPEVTEKVNDVVDEAEDFGDENIADHDEIQQDQEVDQQKVDDHLNCEEDEATAAEDATQGEAGMGGAAEDQEDSNDNTASAEDDHAAQSDPQERSDKSHNQEESKSRGTASRREVGEAGERGDADTPQSQALKKLGDILEQFHRQQREILQHSEQQEKQDDDLAMGDADVDVDYEHVDDDQRADTQALGAATKDQARALDDSKAIDDRDTKADEDNVPTEAEKTEQELQVAEALEAIEQDLDHTMNDLQQQQTNAGAFVPKRSLAERQQLQEAGKDQDKDIPDLDNDTRPVMQIDQVPTAMPMINLDRAAHLWHTYSQQTHAYSLLLTEQLRLILNPTQATKLRGDFRTGKRLNLKRIIPYIASGYKRDKIWLRRSQPSKRNYQVMIALDDSKSMGADAGKAGAGPLALQSLALLAKSLSQLDVGQVCITSFSSPPLRIAHLFETPFTEAAGPSVFSHFSFAATKTDVLSLVAESVELFRDARSKARGGGNETWQLCLIVSDGICEKHEDIRWRVRGAMEERIMFVFVIVDNIAADPGGNAQAAGSSGQASAGYSARQEGSSSILDLTSATFEADASDPSRAPKLKIKRYLEGFPFPYYLIVRDVRDLPGVLATALKGWFAEVVDVRY